MITEMPDPPNAVHRASAGAIRYILSDSDVRGDYTGRLTVMSTRRIAETILGFDPTVGQNTNTSYGGKSAEHYFNRYLSMGRLRKVLDTMVEQAVVQKVTRVQYPRFPAEFRLMRVLFFPSDVRTGYVLTDLLAASVATDEARSRDRQRDKLLAEAEKAVAERHLDEVAALYAAHCAEAGLDPEREMVANPERKNR